MVTLNKPAGLSLYLADLASNPAGVAFLPDMDTGADKLLLTEDHARNGFFACWSGGALDDDGLTKIDTALLDARENAPPGGRAAFQFFKSGEENTRQEIAAAGATIVEQILPLHDAEYGRVNRAMELALQSSKLHLSGSALEFRPIDNLLTHFLVQNDDLEIDVVTMELTGNRAGVFEGKVVVEPSTLGNNGFAMAATRRGNPIDDEEDINQEFEVEVGFRQPIRGGGLKGENSIVMRFGYDPISGLSPERTFLEPEAGQPLLSEFLTTHGHQVVLTPLEQGEELDAQLSPRFSYVQYRTEERPSLNEVDYRRSTLLLEGDFDVSLVDSDFNSVETPPQQFGVVIGDSQHEFLPTPDDETLNNTPLTFSLRRGAGHVGEEDEVVEEGRLTAAHAGADQILWGQLKKGSVSEGEVVSEARDVRRLVVDDALADGVLAFQHDPFKLTRKGSADHQPDGFVPVFPYNADLGGTEKKPPISVDVATERRRMLDVAASDSEVLSTEIRHTSLGFEITEVNGKVTKITLARTPRKPRGDDTSINAELTISAPDSETPIEGEVLNAVIRNQLFMVTNRSKDFSGSGGAAEFHLKGELELSGWGFQIDLWSHWKELEDDGKPIKGKRPIVIVKGFEGLSIKELMERSQIWSGKGYIKSRNPALSGIQFVQAEFAKAVAKADASEDPMFETFKQAIKDPNWNGVMVIEVPILPQVLPDQVKGLLGGIDMNNLRAHHLAIPVRRIADQSGSPLSKPFAAINYEAELKDVEYNSASTMNPGDFDGPRQAPNGSDGAYENSAEQFFKMKVTVLRVGFNNGVVQSFYCEIDVTLNSFFHDTGITLLKDGSEVQSNTITLKGRFVRRVTDGVPSETYDFFTEDRFEIKMQENFPLLSKITLSRIAYASQSVKQGENELASSQFLMSGEIEFKELGDFDFLDVKKVSFNGLSLDMRFLIPPSGSIGFPRFRFSPGSLIFDFSKSVAKDSRGFFGSLPLKFTGFGWLGDLVTLPKLGYFSLNKKGGDAESAPFFLKFDLDLGSLGSFASSLGDFKMDLGLVFGFDAHNDPLWDLGFKFGGSGGKDLDVGLQGFLEFRCERYEVVTLEYQPSTGGDAITYYGFRGLNAKLIVFGKEMPPEGEMSMYLFVDPEKIDRSDGIGWLLAGKDLADTSVIDLKLLALGQRVDPFGTLGNGFLTTRDVINKFGDIIDGVEEPGNQGDPHKVSANVTYNPERGWTIGFNSTIYRFINLGFVVVDPELAGILLDVKLGADSDDTLFSIDVLYRKLTDDLGVYSVEVVLPPYLRNWQFGAAGITIPAIGIEIFTDGNWGIDIGYPADKDFSRSFHLNIIPFTGAGGFYYRRVSGPAARLIPGSAKSLTSGETIPYNPVTEIGLGMRVGLGVTLAQGILNAGISLTVYGYLEGAYGRLDNPNNLPTHAKRSYIMVSGAVGIMGELYGYVDFGIVKAGIFVQIYAEVGFRLETDRAALLYIEVGVRVRVRVVIASFKVFGKRIEIAICFSFATTIRFSRTIGSDNRAPYNDSELLEVETAEALSIPNGIREEFTWSGSIPKPEHWAGIEDKIPLDVVIQPDMTFAPGDAGPELHAVYMMAAKLSTDETIAPIERLIQGLVAWAICAGIEGIEPSDLDTVTLNTTDLLKLREKFAKTSGKGPDYASIIEFLSEGFEGTAELPVDETVTGDLVNADPAAIMPVPNALRVVRETAGGSDEIRFADFKFVNATYRADMEKAIKRFVHAQREPDDEALTVGDNISLAMALTEEWVEMIIRAGLDRLAEAAQVDDIETTGDEKTAEGEEMLATGRLAKLVEEYPAREEEEEGNVVRLRSQAAEIAATAGRFFTYGQRIPHPNHEGITLPDWIETPSRPSDAGSDVEERYFHAMLRLGGLQFPIANAVGLSIPADTYDGWLTVPAGVDTGVISTDKITSIMDTAGALELPGTLSADRLFAERPRHISLGTREMATVLPKDIDGRDHIWMFSTEARSVAAKAGDTKPNLAKAIPAKGQPQKFEKLKGDEAASLVPAIVIDVALRKAAPQNNAEGLVGSPDAFEIKAIPEPLRNLIDPFAPTTDGGDPTAKGITAVNLFKILPGGIELLGDSDDTPVTLVQSNLSVEVKPDPVNDLLEALSGTRIAPVADRTEGQAFVQLLRQAAIVNTGGYHLTYPGAGADLEPLFAGSGSGDPVNDTARLRLVISLDPNEAGSFSRANAYLSDSSLSTGVDLDERTVLAIKVDDIRDPLHNPGVIPVRFERTEPVAGTIERELAERFSNLALDVTVRDETGTVVGRQYLDQAISTGPDFIEDSDHTTNERVFKASIPVGKLAKFEEDSEIYKIVGGSASVRGEWRDIYGNSWGKPLDSIDVAIVYNDRLLGLSGLPYTRVSYWPGEMALTLALGFERSYQGLAALDTEKGEDGEFVPAEFIENMERQLEEDAEHLRRARRQILDERVTIVIVTPLGDPVNLNNAVIAEHLLQTEEDLKRFKAEFGEGINNKDRETLRTAIKALAVDRQFVLEQYISIPAGPTDSFTEFAVSLEVNRPSPKDEPGLYDDVVVTEAHDEDNSDPANSLRELWSASETLMSNLQGNDADATGNFGFGDASAFLTALGDFAPEHRIATGYGEVAGVTERSTWLVRRDYLEEVTGDELFADVKPTAYALPPLRTEAYNKTFNITTLENENVTHKIVDADADGFGRRALERMERLLSPSIAVPMLAEAAQSDTTSGTSLDNPDSKRRTTREAIKRLLAAKENLAIELSGRLKTVFTSDTPNVNVSSDRLQRIEDAAADMMKRDLTNHYRVTSFMAYFDPDGSGIPDDVRVAHGSIRQAGTDTGIRMRAFNMPLAPEGGAISNDLLVICEAASDSSATGNDAFDPPEAFDVSYIQRQSRPDFASGEISYRKTAWLKLIVPEGEDWASVKLKANEAVVPNILRELPELPILDNEAFRAPEYVDGVDPVTNLKNARRWVSSRDISWEARVNDRLTATIRYEEFGVAESLNVSMDLTSRIVRFVLETDGVIDAIENGQNIDAYSWASEKAEALATVVEIESLEEAVDGTNAFDSVILNERMIDGELNLVASNVNIYPPVPENGSDEFVAVSSFRNQRELRYGLMEGDLLSFDSNYTGPLGGDSQDGLQLRRLESHGLDILTLASAETEISLTRNEFIQDEPLLEDFVYRLPTIASGERVVPGLDIAGEVTSGTIEFSNGVPANFEEVLNTFLDNLMKPIVPTVEAAPLADVVFEYESGLFNEGKGGSEKPVWREEGGPVIAIRSGLDPKSTSYNNDVAILASEISDWLATNPAHKDGKPLGALVADARVYVAKDNTSTILDRRVLRLRRCCFKFD